MTGHLDNRFLGWSRPYVSRHLPRVEGSPTLLRVTKDKHCFRVRVTRGERSIVMSFPHYHFELATESERRSILINWHDHARRKLRGEFF